MSEGYVVKRNYTGIDPQGPVTKQRLTRDCSKTTIAGRTPLQYLNNTKPKNENTSLWNSAKEDYTAACEKHKSGQTLTKDEVQRVFGIMEWMQSRQAANRKQAEAGTTTPASVNSGAASPVSVASEPKERRRRSRRRRAGSTRRRKNTRRSTRH